MSKLPHRALRANALALCALALSAAFALAPAAANAATATHRAAHHHVHARAMQARAEAPESVMCGVTGCEFVPPHCHAVPQPGVEPGYQMLACP